MPTPLASGVLEALVVAALVAHAKLYSLDLGDEFVPVVPPAILGNVVALEPVASIVATVAMGAGFTNAMLVNRVISNRHRFFSLGS